MSQILNHDFPGKGIRLRYEAWDEEYSEIDLAKLVIDHVFLLSENLFEPLSVELSLTYCHPEYYFSLSEPTPEHPFWLLQHENLPQGVKVEPTYVNEIITIGNTKTLSSIVDWITMAFEQSCGSETRYIVAWEELEFRTTQARLPIQDIASNTLYSWYGNRYPVERYKDSFWINGPRDESLTPPIYVRVYKDARLLTLDLSLYWSFWTEPTEPGYFEVKQAIERLVALGWKHDSLNDIYI